MYRRGAKVAKVTPNMDDILNYSAYPSFRSLCLIKYPGKNLHRRGKILLDLLFQVTVRFKEVKAGAQAVKSNNVLNVSLQALI